MSKEVWCFWWRVVWLHKRIKHSERRSIALQMGSSHLKRNKATSRWTEHTCILDLKWRNLPQQIQICLIPHICVCFSRPRYSGLLFQPSDRRTQRHLKVTGTISVADARNYCCTPEHRSKKRTRCLFEDQRLLLEHFYTCTEGTRPQPNHDGCQDTITNLKKQYYRLSVLLLIVHKSHRRHVR